MRKTLPNFEWLLICDGCRKELGVIHTVGEGHGFITYRSKKGNYLHFCTEECMKYFLCCDKLIEKHRGLWERLPKC